jgi:peptidoglycan/LPS O-acetylase OafA/YrhL
MEGLRGLAILLVFACHYYDIVWRDLPGQSRLLSGWGNTLMETGGTGVDLFFILSGYLIYSAVRKPGFNFRRFIERRAVRIYPAFLAVLAFYLAVSPFLHSWAPLQSRYANRVPAAFPDGLLYVAANVLFLPGVTTIPPIMNVAWSLSYEWAFYLGLPVIVGLFGFRRWTRKVRVGFLMAAAVLFLGANILSPAIFYVVENPRQPSHVRAVMFIGGMLLSEFAELKRTQPPSRLRLVDLSAVSVFACGLAVSAYSAIAIHIPPTDLRIVQVKAFESAALLAGYVCFVAAALTPGAIVSHALSVTWLRRLGNMSYSFYLFHGIPLHAFALCAARLRVTSVAEPWIWLEFLIALPLVLFTTTAAGAVLYLTVEKPLSLTRHRARNDGRELTVNSLLEASR